MQNDLLHIFNSLKTLHVGSTRTVHLHAFLLFIFMIIMLPLVFIVSQQSQVYRSRADYALPIPTIIGGYGKPAPTDSGHGKPAPTGSDRGKPVPTNSGEKPAAPKNPFPTES